MTLGTTIEPIGVLLMSFGSAATPLDMARTEGFNAMPGFIRALADVVHRELVV